MNGQNRTKILRFGQFGYNMYFDFVWVPNSLFFVSLVFIFGLVWFGFLLNQLIDQLYMFLLISSTCLGCPFFQVGAGYVIVAGSNYKSEALARKEKLVF